MNFAEQIEAVLHAVRFHSPTSYSWLGMRAPQIPKPTNESWTPQSQRDWVLFKLQTQLYSDFYCTGSPVHQNANGNGHPSASTEFVRRLSAVNCGKGYRSQGWICEGSENDQQIVNKGGLRLWVQSQDCLNSIDDGIALPFPKELFSISPGFYVAYSDKDLGQADRDVLVRLYWNLTAEGAIAFVQHTTRALNEAAVPFRLKAISDPQRFSRCDAVVLYIRKVDYQAASEVLAQIYPEIAPDLKSAVPALTKRLAAGVGLAEDPGEGESYGSHRCRVLAEGLMQTYEQRKHAVRQQLASIRDHFEANGIRWDKPFLVSSKDDDYAFRLREGRCTKKAAIKEATAEGCLEAAAEIARQLEREALWHDGCCNWIGPVNNPAPSDDLHPTKQYHALGPDLYSGTSGIALFQAELHTVTGDHETRRCALGAIRHALSRLDILEQHNTLGLYAGGIGVALVAARVGTLLGSDDLLAASLQAVHRIDRLHQSHPEPEFDLISGKAGAIAGLIILNGLLSEGSALDFAIRLGDELLQSSEDAGYGLSWRSSAQRSRKNLTGFAHGAAGVGFALSELFRATGAHRYRTAAERAFDYERHWFDESVGNWPDFRRSADEPYQTGHRLRFTTAWCHGAPGIALSRLHAFKIFGEQKHKTEALQALHTTYQSTKTSLEAGTRSGCLCHGLSGNADILHDGWQVLQADFACGRTIACDVACTMMAGPSDDDPGLMLGLAGKGYFYLRMGHSSTPSVLCCAAR